MSKADDDVETFSASKTGSFERHADRQHSGECEWAS